jgi:tRNA(Ile)-lysidine synthase
MPTSLARRFAAHLGTLRLEPGRAIVAVSGGCDSIALLDLLLATRATHGLELMVGHVDHGIHPESREVAGRVEALARDAGLTVVLGQLHLGPDASETTARTARYAWLHDLRVGNAARYILTAHHADDQSETVLLRVLAGTGPSGLAAMRGVSGQLVRPLLPFLRRELEDYVAARRLWTWDDPANHDPRHLRSWIRGTVLPLLRERSPDVDHHLQRVSRLASRQRSAWDEVLDALPGLSWQAELDGASLVAAALADLPPALARAVAMAFVRRAGGMLGERHAHRLVRFARTAKSGAQLELPGHWRVEHAFGRLRLLPPDHSRSAAPTALTALPATLDGGLSWGGWRLTWQPDVAPPTQERDAMTAWFIPGGLTVRQWQPGDRVAPLRGAGQRLAVRCFQEARVPRSRRLGWPIVTREGTVLWIPGICRSAHLIPVEGTPAVRVDVAAS